MSIDSARTVAGCSQLSPEPGVIISTVLCFTLQGMGYLAGSWACGRTDLDYQAGYLAYREGPAIIKAFDMLSLRPDFMLLPASGIHHPRGMGMARHLGHLLSVPAIGVTRNPLGRSGDIPSYRPSKGRGRIFVSPGWGVDPEGCMALVARTMGKHRMPEPIHRAKVACRRISARWTSRTR